MPIGFTKPDSNVFADYASWERWLKQQPEALREIFSETHRLPDGTFWVPFRSPSEDEFYSVLSQHPVLSQHTSDPAYGGSGVFSARHTQLIGSVTQPQIRADQNVFVSQMKDAAPGLDTEAQMSTLRAEVLPGLEKGVSLIDGLMAAKTFTFEGGQFEFPPMVLNLLTGYITGYLKNEGIRHLYKQLNSAQIPEAAVTAWKLYDSFYALKIGETSLGHWLRQNHARLRSQMDLETQGTGSLLAVPQEMAGLMARELFSKEFLWQLRGIDKTEVYGNVAEGMADLKEGLVETIDNIKDIGTWQEGSLVNATGRYSVFKLLEYFPNPQAQEYLLKKIGIEAQVLAADTKPAHVSEEIWRAHQEFKSLQGEYAYVNLGAGVATVGAVIGLCAIAPYLSPVFAAAVAGAGIAMGAGVPVLDLMQEENRNLAVWSSFVAGGVEGDQGVHEFTNEADTATADRRLDYAVAKTPVEIGLNVVGMGASAKIATSGLSVGARVAADAGVGAGLGAVTPMADGRQWEDGMVVEAMLLGAGLGAAGGAAGTAVGAARGARARRLAADAFAGDTTHLAGLEGGVHRDIGTEPPVATPREHLGESGVKGVSAEEVARRGTHYLVDARTGAVSYGGKSRAAEASSAGQYLVYIEGGRATVVRGPDARGARIPESRAIELARGLHDKLTTTRESLSGNRRTTEHEIDESELAGLDPEQLMKEAVRSVDNRGSDSVAPRQTLTATEVRAKVARPWADPENALPLPDPAPDGTQRGHLGAAANHDQQPKFVVSKNLRNHFWIHERERRSGVAQGGERKNYMPETGFGRLLQHLTDRLENMPESERTRHERLIEQLNKNIPDYMEARATHMHVAQRSFWEVSLVESADRSRELAHTALLDSVHIAIRNIVRATLDEQGPLPEELHPFLGDRNSLLYRDYIATEAVTWLWSLLDAGY